MLSIPRELQVTFTAPNGEVITNRINSAYTYGYEENGGTSGGVKLMYETIKDVLGITVNHVFVTNFPDFKRAVNEMGCVYMTVDRRYYHVNEPGGEQYFEINLPPGYQRLCGQQALEFVANRHEDSSLTRDARDQRFLLSVKAQYGPTALENREKFERIFGKAVETDLQGTEQVLELLELLAESAGKPVRQVPFHVNLLATYDTASQQQIEESVHSFLHGTAAIPSHSLNSRVRSVHPRAVPASPSLGLTPTPSAASAEARALAANLPFAVEAPRYQQTTAEASPDTLRRYDILGTDRQLYPAYVLVIDHGGLGEYYDVEGTTWSEPPLLAHPTSQVHLGSRTYDLFYDGENLKTIAWHEAGNSYWVENTLTNAISPQVMAAIAEQTVPVAGPRASSGTPRPTTLRSLKLPSRPLATTTLAEKLGAGFAFAVLAALAVLSVLLLRRRRELRVLRERLAGTLTREAQRPLSQR
jgi:LCP family protein required for cell wall assembly